MSFHEIILPSIVTLIGVFGGLIVGRHLTDRTERKKRDDELNNVKKLLSLDYSRIYHYYNNVSVSQRNFHGAYNLNTNILLPFVIDANSLQDLLVMLTFTKKFAYWDALFSSGSLIRLPPRDLEIIQVSHDTILATMNNQENAWQALALELERVVTNVGLTPNTRVLVFQRNINQYFRSLFAGYETMNVMVNAIREIDWLDLDAILHSENISNPNLPAQPEITVNQNEPYVTSEGITVYPNGVRVDSHGTIL